MDTEASLEINQEKSVSQKKMEYIEQDFVWGATFDNVDHHGI